MHQQFQLSSTTTLFYRYNPQADVLAVRLEPDFQAADERPLADQPAVSLSHDSTSGALLGLRIGGVQQLLLQSLIRDVVRQALPQLLGDDDAATRTRAVAAPVAMAPEAPSAGLQPAGADAQALHGAMAVTAASLPTPTMPPPTPTPSMPPTAWAAPSPAIATTTAAAAAVASELHEPAAADLGWEEDEDPSEAPDMADGAGDRNRRRRRRRRRRGEGPAMADGAGAERQARDGFDAAASPLAPAAAADLGLIDGDVAGATPGWSDAALDEDDETDFLVALPERPGGERRSRRRRRGRRGLGQAAEPADRSADLSAPDAEADDRSHRPQPLEAHAADLAELPGEPLAEAHWDDEGRPCPAAFAPLGLHPRVTHAIHDLGFNNPTPIQEASIPVTLTGEDLIGLAQTGTGKTLAFVAPALSRMLESRRPDHRPRMLILAPTRELAVQVALEAERLAAHTDLRVATIYGGVSMGAQTEALRRGVDLVVATPGRILDHLRRRNVSLDAVETLVLDEADRMLDMGFLPDVRAIIRQLPAGRQTLLFTATFPPEIESLSLEFQRKPRTVEIARRKPPESIDQRLYPVGKHLKAPLLVHMLENDPAMDRVLVFTERKVDADVLARKLRQDGVSVALMHGDRTQVEREQALAALKARKVRVLVATNVAARGLDIEDISHVVNYDVPQSIDEYVHRIGRTARAENEGKAYSLVTLGDEAMISRIEGALGRQLPRAQAPGFNYDVPPPAWAKPSANDVLAWLNKETSTADRLRVLSRRRR